MSNRRPALAVALVLASILLAAACASTQVTKTWTSPGFDKKSVKKILVLGISQNDLIRRIYEDTFAVELEKLGYKAISGYLWVADALHLDKDAVIARMKTEGVTNVIVTRIVSSKEVATYTGPTVAVGVGYGGYSGFGPPYYGSWSMYYSTSYAAVMDPAYTTINEVVTLETNFYDGAKTDDALVWSGESATWTDTSKSGKKIAGLVHALVYKMRAARVL
jgi:hypothetical protein